VKDYLPRLRGKYRVWGIVLFSVTALWLIGFLAVLIAVRPSPVWIVLLGIPIMYAGVIVLLGLCVGLLYVFRAPLRARAAELSRADNAVFCITVDPLWMPLGSSSADFFGPGFLIVDSEGIRIVDDSDREILVASWDEVADIRPSRAPRPVAELELHRGGEITQWWFYVFGPRAFRRRGSRGITRFVGQVRAMRPNTSQPPAG